MDQMMACCLTAPSQYLNRCWLINTKTLRNISLKKLHPTPLTSNSQGSVQMSSSPLPKLTLKHYFLLVSCPPAYTHIAICTTYICPILWWYIAVQQNNYGNDIMGQCAVGYLAGVEDTLGLMELVWGRIMSHWHKAPQLVVLIINKIHSCYYQKYLMIC